MLSCRTEHPESGNRNNKQTEPVVPGCGSTGLLHTVTEMDKNEKSILGLLTAGLVMEAVRALVTVLMHCFPAQVLKLTGKVFTSTDLQKLTVQPLYLLRPLLHFGIMLALFLLLRSECRKPTSLSGILPVLIPVGSVLLTVAGAVFSYFTVHLIAARQGAAELAAMSQINTVSSLITVLFSPSLLVFGMAAGAVWYRGKQTET